MSKQFLLREYYQTDLEKSRQYLLESNIQDDGMYLVGIIQAANRKNGNGRIYPRAILEREMNIYDKLIREGRALGELDHPDTEEVRLAEVSHVLERSWWEGDEVYGKIRVLPTPKGEILKKLIESRVQVGISSRSLGSVRESQDGLIVEELILICFDIVANPSTANAFMLRESQSSIFDIYNRPDVVNRKLVEILSFIENGGY